MQSVTTSDMQAYIDKRLRDSNRKKPIRPETVRKEVATFRLIWNWAVKHGHVVGPASTNDLKYPKIEYRTYSASAAAELSSVWPPIRSAAVYWQGPSHSTPIVPSWRLIVWYESDAADAKLPLDWARTCWCQHLGSKPSTAARRFEQREGTVHVDSQRRRCEPRHCLPASRSATRAVRKCGIYRPGRCRTTRCCLHAACAAVAGRRYTMHTNQVVQRIPRQTFWVS